MRASQSVREVAELEAAFAQLNDGGNGYAFASAPLAVSALLDLLDGGAHILASEGLRADIYRIMEGIRRRSAGHRVGFVDMADMEAVEAAVTEETKLLWVETLAGPRLSDPDLAALAAFARARDIFVAVDNSALTHAMVRPLAEGCHIVFSEAPGRALGGQDIGTRGGLVSFSPNAGFAEDRFAFLQKAYDVLPEPGQASEMNAALVRIPAEIAARSACAGELAQILRAAPFVREIFYRVGGAAEFSVTFEGTAEAVARNLERLAGFRPAPSVGLPGTYWHYARRTYEAVPEEIRTALGIPDGIVRFGVPAGDAERLAGAFSAAFG